MEFKQINKGKGRRKVKIIKIIRYGINYLLTTEALQEKRHKGQKNIIILI